MSKPDNKGPVKVAILADTYINGRAVSKGHVEEVSRQTYDDLLAAKKVEEFDEEKHGRAGKPIMTTSLPATEQQRDARDQEQLEAKRRADEAAKLHKK